MAVANQNEGNSILTQGALTLVTNFRETDGPTTKRVLFSNLSESGLLANGVELPLTRASLEYWKTNPDFNQELFTDAYVNAFDPATVLDPEFIAFNNDGTKIFLNLQENSALAVIDSDVDSATYGEVKFIDGYGPKSFTSGDGVDIVDDGECQLYTHPCLYLARRPDGIDTVEIDGEDYVFTADEGSDFDISNGDEEWEEKVDSEDLISETGDLSFAGMTFTGDATCLDNFKTGCTAAWCSNFEMTMAAPYVNYADAANPTMDKIVGIGGRGMSIFKVGSSGIDLVWDSVSSCTRQSERISMQNISIFPDRHVLVYFGHRVLSLKSKLATEALRGLVMLCKMKISLLSMALVMSLSMTMIRKALMKRTIPFLEMDVPLTTATLEPVP